MTYFVRQSKLKMNFSLSGKMIIIQSNQIVNKNILAIIGNYDIIILEILKFFGKDD